MGAVSIHESSIVHEMLLPLLLLAGARAARQPRCRSRPPYRLYIGHGGLNRSAIISVPRCADTDGLGDLLPIVVAAHCFGCTAQLMATAFGDVSGEFTQYGIFLPAVCSMYSRCLSN